MKTAAFFVILCFLPFISKAQFTQYIIELTDKVGSPFSVSNPEAFLSKRAIDRRARQNISIVDDDLPVNPRYLDSIRSAGAVVIKNTSKWLNQVCIETSDPSALDKIAAFSFVKASRPSRRLADPSLAGYKFQRPELIDEAARIVQKSDLSYGGSADQIQIHNGDFLHQNGFTGRGMMIAVIDDGFYHVQTLPAFDSIRLTNRILDSYDFVDNKSDMDEEDDHGMHCLSIIAANVPGKMIGSAPGAGFLLYRSENVHAEYRGEEQNWVAAAERSDSAGADVITTSLGYNTFDNPVFNYSYQDMDGQTTIMARGARIAASKGMILMMAAGNEGNNSWHYITTPADAFNVLTVGAVGKTGNPAGFSSFGPTADGRIKPDVSSVGVGTYLQGGNGNFGSGNGTSYATPNLAGLVACLWQAYPDFTSFEIMDVVRKSSSSYSNPNDKIGFGIPDFEAAYKSLRDMRAQRQAAAVLQDHHLFVYPNPVSELATVLVRVPVSGNASLRLYDAYGRLCSTQSETLTANTIKVVFVQRNGLQSGIYILKVDIGSFHLTQKILMQ